MSATEVPPERNAHFAATIGIILKVMNMQPGNEETKSKRVTSRGWSLIHLAIMVLGGFLRARIYFSNQSLWLDEAALGLNILGRDFGQLLGPLDYNQVAPQGFLLLEKIMTLVLGSSELVLRAIPFLASLATLLAVYVLARDLMGSGSVALTLLLVSLNWPLIDYAAELKPYSLDAFIATLLVWMGFRIHQPDERREKKDFLKWSALGGVATWLSFPAIFVLTVVCVVILVRAYRDSPRARRQWIALLGFWVASAGASLTATRANFGNQNLQAYWAGAFMPFPPRDVQDLRWFVVNAQNLQHDVLGMGAISGALLLIVIGWRIVYRRFRYGVILLIAPIGFALVASSLHLYPFSGRLLIFLIPMLFLALSAGTSHIVRLGHGASAVMSVLVVMLLFYRPIDLLHQGMLPLRGREQIRPLLDLYQRHHQPGDQLYIYYSTYPAFEYYRRYRGYSIDDPEAVVTDINHRSDPRAYLSKIRSLFGQRRVWFLFSHVSRKGPVGNEMQYITDYLDCVGTIELRSSEQGAAIFLYNLEGAPEAAAGCDPLFGQP